MLKTFLKRFFRLRHEPATTILLAELSLLLLLGTVLYPDPQFLQAAMAHVPDLALHGLLLVYSLEKLLQSGCVLNTWIKAASSVLGFLLWTALLVLGILYNQHVNSFSLLLLVPALAEAWYLVIYTNNLAQKYRS